MMGVHGVSMVGYGLLGWILNLVVIGIVVYASVNLALRKNR
ncbi:hypothetical protein [Bacillus sp. PS06]|nr:hypothetical protein [Bacillus sp. PS06]